MTMVVEFLMYFVEIQPNLVHVLVCEENMVQCQMCDCNFHETPCFFSSNLGFIAVCVKFPSVFACFVHDRACKWPCMSLSSREVLSCHVLPTHHPSIHDDATRHIVGSDALPFHLSSRWVSAIPPPKSMCLFRFPPFAIVISLDSCEFPPFGYFLWTFLGKYS